MYTKEIILEGGPFDGQRRNIPTEYNTYAEATDMPCGIDEEWEGAAVYIQGGETRYGIPVFRYRKPPKKNTNP